MITINLTPKQLEVTKMAVATFIEQLTIDLRESTCSEITNNRHKIMLEVWKILKEAKSKR